METFVMFYGILGTMILIGGAIVAYKNWDILFPKSVPV
jgi:uncharacterized membrane protein